MKKLIILLLCMIPVIACAQDNYTVTVKIPEHNPNVQLYMLSHAYGKASRDSARIVNGVAIISGHVDRPTMANLLVLPIGTEKINMPTQETSKPIYLEPGNISVVTGDSIQNAVVSGTVSNNEYTRYQHLITKAYAVRHELAIKYYKAERNKDSAAMKTIMIKLQPARDSVSMLSRQFVKANPDSYVSLSLLAVIIMNDGNLKPGAEELYDGLSPRMRATMEGQIYKKMINVGIGHMAPAFEQGDTSGKPVRLADFKGEYVLLDFWASWCAPCRAENPNLVKAYNMYKDKNFTILSVSLDRPDAKNAWLAAIKHDGLKWTQVSDLQFWTNAVARLYGIQALPQNFLIDPSGKIIAKSLSGNDLINKLREVLQ